jgi:RimJ/RimL family protein N-acetyltransferase
VLDAYQYFVARGSAGEPLGLIVGLQQSTICMDCHALMLPEARGKRRAEVFNAFISWLPAASGYRKLIASVPVYNRPMILAARAAGFTQAGVNRLSVLRGGKLYDQVILERTL